MNQDSRIYVAGHTGLIGSALVRRLKAEAYRHLLTRTHRALDLTDGTKVERFFRREKPEYVFLAAARAGGIRANRTYPADFIYDNLMIQTHVIDQARRHGVKKLLFLSSSCVYPKRCKQPMQEEDLLTGALEPTNEPFAVAKLAGIKLCESYARQYGAGFFSVIPANVYGPHDHFDEDGHVLAALVDKFHKARENEDPEVVVWGTGRPRREFFYVDDVADACIFLMKRYDGSGVINVGPGQETSIAQLARRIGKITGFRGTVRFDPRHPDGNPRRLLDSGKMFALGWKPSTSLEEGLKRTYAWYRKHIAGRSS